NGIMALKLYPVEVCTGMAGCNSTPKNAIFTRRYESFMYRLLLPLIICMLFQHPMLAQIDESVLPQTSTLPASLFSKIDEFVFPPFQMDDVASREDTDGRNGDVPRFAHARRFSVSPAETGSWTELGSGNRVWRMHITSPGALSLIPVFSTLYLPP